MAVTIDGLGAALQVYQICVLILIWQHVQHLGRCRMAALHASAGNPSPGAEGPVRPHPLHLTCLEAPPG